MTAQHTSGPWRLGKDEMGELHTVWGAQAGVAITSVFDNVFGPDCPPQAEATANARLIAAAPDLLAALREMVYAATHLSAMDPTGAHDCTISGDTLAKARAAIAKAVA